MCWADLTGISPNQPFIQRLLQCELCYAASHGPVPWVPGNAFFFAGMNTLIISLPSCRRQSFTDVAASADDREAAASTGMGDDNHEYAYVMTANGQSATRQGSATPDKLPRADAVVVVLEPADVSWHRLSLPKAPAGRLRQALGGLLEEALLVDPEELHLAVAPGAKAGDLTWIAACRHTWLTSHLMALDKANLRVDRVVPAVWPDAPPTAYFQELPGGAPHANTSPDGEGEGPALMLTWSTPDGVGSWPLFGSMARSLLPEPLPANARWLATPPAAAPAERWLGHAVQSRLPAEQWLHASRSMWNLLQFDLQNSSKGAQFVSDGWRQFMGPSWRPVRWGLLALVMTQVVGLNVWAWKLKHDLKWRKAEMTTLLRQTHPQVPVILNPEIQMRRETDALRAASGEAGPSDMEFLMRAVTSAWVGDQPAKALVYDGESLDVGVPDSWRDDDMGVCMAHLEQAGFQLERTDRQLRVRASSAPVKGAAS
jgi:general secretion pathway protein L